MNSDNFLQIAVQANAKQCEQLLTLQATFAKACNAISPIAHQNRCWNRVALHHLVYRKMRSEFESLGSQMICNAVYSVCRIYRMAYENPNSPFCGMGLGSTALPLIKFLENTPVFFDRHTLSIKGNVLSMFTLDGRVRFQSDLKETDLAKFSEQKLKEITLTFENQQFFLSFLFAHPNNKIIDLQQPNYVVAIQATDAIELQKNSIPATFNAQGQSYVG